MTVRVHMADSYRASPKQHSYSSPTSSDTSSNASVFSVDANSQTSESSTGSTESISVSWNQEDACRSTSPEQVTYTVRPTLAPLQINTQNATLASDQRQHPRRCMTSAHQRPPPTLVRQSDRKGHFVDSLVDSATLMVEVIWPLSTPANCTVASVDGQAVLPLRFFIQETLRRSKTSFSTLQVALYYLILIKAHLPRQDFTMEQAVDCRAYRALQCGRRMFLAALILASKYLQDRNYSARAWSKISGLKVCEINANEMAFLKAVNWKLHVPEQLFERWQSILLKYTSPTSPSACSPLSAGSYEWRSLIQRLSPELDNVCPWMFDAPRAVRAPMAPLRISTLQSSFQPSLVSPISPYPPRTLEPVPNMPPPTPSLVRMGPLPTPILTPQTVVNTTPASGYAGFESGRSAMCSAMAAVRSQNMSNSCMDFFASRSATPSRRPSIISSASSTSSPESMVSDHSRFSRASSISSASSLTSTNACAATPHRLARMATLRNAGMTYTLPPMTPVREKQAKDTVPFGYVTMEPIVAEPMSSPDMDGFNLNDLESPSGRQSLSRTVSNESVASKRKRGQSSVDMTLQQNVRNLLNASNVIDITESPRVSVIADSSVASSFLFENPKALQLPMSSVPEARKRACQRKENVSYRPANPVWYDLTQDA